MVCLFVLLFTAFSQCALSWERTYGFHGYNATAYSIAPVEDGSYILLGDLRNATGCCFLLMKVDSVGDTVWTKTYQPEGLLGFIADYDCANPEILMMPNGELILVGNALAPGSCNQIFPYALKTNSDGDTIWTKVYPFKCLVQDVTMMSDDKIIVLGRSPTDADSCLLFCLRSNGDTIWTRVYDSIVPYSVAVTPDTELVIVGHGYGSDGNLKVVKADGFGTTLWIRGYSKAGGRVLYLGTSVVVCSTGEIAILGVGWEFTSGGDYDYCFLLLNYDGDTIRTASYNRASLSNPFEESSDYPVNLSVIKDTLGFGIVGYSQANLSYATVIWMVRASYFGDTMWTKTFSQSSGENCGYFVTSTYDGGFAIVGYTNNTFWGDTLENNRIYLIKTDSLGNVDWVREVPQKPQSISLNVYPSPFNSSCVISAPAGSDVEIYDVNGRLVWSSSIYGASGYIRRGDLSPRSIVWTPDESVRSGIYFVRAKVGNQAITKRVVFIR